QGGVDGSWQPISPDVTAGILQACEHRRNDVVSAIAVAPSAPQRIYSGSTAGKIFVTKDDGATWTDVTKAPLPARWITSIAVDPSNPDTVYASFSGFSSATPGTPGHIFKSADAGGTWTQVDLALGALDAPVDSLVAHPVASNLLYAATDYGIAVTTD